MATDYPNDADGDALRLVARHGSDMTQPMLIDFAVDAPSEKVADLVVAHLKVKDFASDKTSNCDGRWTVTVPVMMPPIYEKIVCFQEALDEDLAQFSAKSDGWGALGNEENKARK